MKVPKLLHKWTVDFLSLHYSSLCFKISCQHIFRAPLKRINTFRWFASSKIQEYKSHSVWLPCTSFKWKTTGLFIYHKLSLPSWMLLINVTNGRCLLVKRTWWKVSEWFLCTPSWTIVLQHLWYGFVASCEVNGCQLPPPPSNFTVWY